MEEFFSCEIHYTSVSTDRVHNFRTGTLMKRFLLFDMDGFGCEDCAVMARIIRALQTRSLQSLNLFQDQSPDAQCAFQEEIKNAINSASSTDKENQDRNNVAKSFTIEDDFSKTLSDVTGTCIHSAQPPSQGKPTK